MLGKRVVFGALAGAMLLTAMPSAVMAGDTFSTAIEYARAAKIKKYIDRQNALFDYYEKYILETGDYAASVKEVQARFGLPLSTYVNLSGEKPSNASKLGSKGINVWVDYAHYRIVMGRNMTSGRLPSLSLQTYQGAPNRDGMDTVSSSGGLNVVRPFSPKLRQFVYFTRQLRAKGNIVNLTAPGDKTKVWYKPNGTGSFEVFRNDGSAWISLGEVGSLTDDRELMLDDPSKLVALPGISGMHVKVKSGDTLMGYTYVNDTDKWVPDGSNANINLGDELPVDMTGTAWVSGDGSGTICTKSQPCTAQVVQQKKDAVQVIHFTGTPAGGCGALPGLLEVEVDSGAGGTVATEIDGTTKSKITINNKGNLNFTLTKKGARGKGEVDIVNAAGANLYYNHRDANNASYDARIAQYKIDSKGKMSGVVEAVVIDATLMDGNKMELLSKSCDLTINGEYNEVRKAALGGPTVVNGEVWAFRWTTGGWKSKSYWSEYNYGGLYGWKYVPTYQVTNNGTIHCLVPTETYTAAGTMNITNKGLIETIIADSFKQATLNYTVKNQGRWERKKNYNARVYAAAGKFSPASAAIGLICSSGYSNNSSYPGGSHLTINNTGVILDSDCGFYLNKYMLNGKGGSVDGLQVSIQNNGIYKNGCSDTKLKYRVNKFTYSGTARVGPNM